jgi:hypothetical protein
MSTTKPYVIIRSTNAGAFAGTLEARDGQEVTLSNARRLWYWDGAASLSELAMKGVSRPATCKFPAPVDRIVVLEVIEVISATPQAKQSIEAVKPWTMH